MDLQQTSPSGAESKVGLEVMPIDGVTLSDGYCPGERTPTRRLRPVITTGAEVMDRILNATGRQNRS